MPGHHRNFDIVHMTDNQAKQHITKALGATILIAPGLSCFVYFRYIRCEYSPYSQQLFFSRPFFLPIVHTEIARGIQLPYALPIPIALSCQFPVDQPHRVRYFVKHHPGTGSRWLRKPMKNSMGWLLKILGIAYLI